MKNNNFIDPKTGDFVDTLKKQTIKNKVTKFNNTIGLNSPRKTVQIVSKIVSNLSQEYQMCLVKRNFPELKAKSNDEKNETLKTICDTYLNQKGIKKSADKYVLLNALSSIIKGKTIKELKQIFSLSHKKASQLKSGLVTRTKRKLKMSVKEKAIIHNFFRRSDISRPQPGLSSKKYGPTSFMRIKGKCAWKKFKSENPQIKVIYSVFCSERPKNIKPLHKTPLNMCQCDKCVNINLKLKVLRIPSIKNEQDLYKMLICEKTGRFRHHNCVEQMCMDCKNWREKIELHAMSLDKNKPIVWQRWENVDYVQKSGKTVTKKKLKTKPGTIHDCINEFIELDVIKPGQNISFVKHFFNQSYQFQLYLDCKNSLKPGQCLGIQDFARNIEIYYRSTIKAFNWSKTQITVHPTVLYFRTTASDELKRIVIIHLSDINTHDATLVHFITKDCIKELSSMYPNEKWKKFFLWSDGCSAQYKGKNTFFFLDKFDVEVERNYFGSEHGKNECDATTGEISIQYRNAVKADDHVISNASDLKNYLCSLQNNNNTTTKIYKLIETDNEDLQRIRNYFDDVTVKVLSGNCTRQLHQIKAGKKPGSLLTRPLSCFCVNCSEKNYDNCYNKGHTKGKFTERILGFSSGNEKVQKQLEENDLVSNCQTASTEIRVEKQKVKLSDLKVDDVIIVPVGENQTEFQPAQIKEIVNIRNILIDFLVPKYDSPEVLVKSTSEYYLNYVIPLHVFIMKLPLPKEQRRNRIIFREKIILNR